jgi:hypothetical protein
MDQMVTAVLDEYREMMRTEREAPRADAPEPRHTSLDHRLLAVGPETGQLINILARSLEAPSIEAMISEPSGGERRSAYDGASIR